MFDRRYGERLEAAFDQVIFDSIKIYNASPLRLMPPRFKSFETGFVIYSGFTSFPEPISKYINRYFHLMMKRKIFYKFKTCIKRSI